MKSLRFSEFGPSSVLRIVDLAIPDPGPGEALVQVKAAAINPSDPKNVSGHFKDTTLPRTPGRDFAGVVVKGRKFKEGQEVWGSVPKYGVEHDGTHEEYIVVQEEALSPKPKSLSMVQAAAIGVPFVTAWASLVNAAQIRAGETILIVGAGGSVGQAATQIAHWKKAHVIGADRTSEIPGVESAINTSTGDLSENVRKLTNGAGVDLVFDTVGGPLFEPALKSLKFGGRQVAITSKGDGRVSFNLFDFYHNLSRLIGVDSQALTPLQVMEIFEELRQGFDSGVLKPPPIEVVPFENAIDAYQRVEAGKAKSKLVLSF